MASVELDPSPATLMLFCDEDSATVFATGKVGILFDMLKNIDGHEVINVTFQILLKQNRVLY